MERTATAWLVLEAGGGPLGVGLVFAARSLPSLLFGLVAGTIADRTDRRRQLLAVSGAAVLVMTALSWLVRGGTLLVWELMAIGFVIGCLQVFDTPARQALILDTVPREHAAQAISLNAVAARLFSAVGALAGGLLIPLLGVATCYLAVAALYALGAALIAAIRAPRTTRVAGAALPPFRRALREAARLAVDIPVVRTLLFAAIACEVFAFSFQSAVPVLARDVLDAGASGLGLLNAAAAIGGTLAVMVLSVVPRQVRREPLLAIVYLVYGVSIVLLGLAHDLIVAAAVLVVIGACAASFDALQQLLIQMAVPVEQRGRAVGVWLLGLGSAPLGHLEMGMLMAAVGAPGALMINGLLVVAGAATLMASAPTYRPLRAGTGT
jgi:MFS family permease